MSAIGVVAIFTATPEGADELGALLESVVVDSHAEEGILRYSLQRAAKNPAVFVMVEKYASKDAFKAHAGTPHMVAFLDKSKSLFAEAPQVIITDFVEVGDPAKSS